MKKTKYYGSIDVDDSNFNVALIKTVGEELLHFKCSSNVSAMVKKIKRKNIHLKDIQLCYEATYPGYTPVQRYKV
ncbi:MAG: hypothetical protein K8F52_06770 [Candidatus Scalindua rubra]|uniref:Transposase n=1 Tax=Candidatus Scalindua brodae TaxID=237368 RepID=A0A0B0EKG5_9BACT|nr:MAG: hypothetical protein SCABRO_01178 [Candidatus Scalindua brodae]MBZ0108354.1 hypothetical protein [Candidatus Scalindua rubra]TWU34052.1 hypothetical protein S225a_13090 [Candidatus Brocadiaceae bacterium S225]